MGAIRTESGVRTFVTGSLDIRNGKPVTSVASTSNERVAIVFATRLVAADANVVSIRPFDVPQDAEGLFREMVMIALRQYANRL